MSIHSTLAAIACVAVLSACAGAPPAPPVPAPPTLAALLAQAEAALAARQEARAIGILKQATLAFPREKAPWLRAAQVSFDCHQYGEAITFAQAALERDPDDIKAHSIAAVSGLRVSSQALRDLAHKNNVTGPVKTEAQQLAKLLRTSIGGDIIVPVKRPLPRQPALKPRVADEDDPFRLLREDMARNGSAAK
ncbi:hypothetical protein KY495_23055 [Massilia sp. PAMC28688]|uniref:tetratricopeptide repeat protein n=1 Tax=Massilia sp. PAMC28688 TaxID=2861283 RepID=UPI001C638907|nr:tetratricopeptide repeat protein [Massilia sp. PAMC28688]QYF93500.1 hypothetical protein KY495_23055 [Massilia sp. PAMC28688]